MQAFLELVENDDAAMLHRVAIRWTPHPVLVSIRDNRDHIRVLL